MSEENLALLGLAAQSLIVGLTFYNCSGSASPYTSTFMICIISWTASYFAYLIGKNRSVLRPALKCNEGWDWPWTKTKAKKSVQFQETVPVVTTASSSRITTTSTEVRCLKNDVGLEEVTQMGETTSAITKTSSDIIISTQTPAPASNPSPKKLPALPPPTPPRCQTPRSKARDHLDSLLRQQTNLELEITFLEREWCFESTRKKDHAKRWKSLRGTGKMADAARKQWELAKYRCRKLREGTESAKQRLEDMGEAIARAERNMVGFG